MIRRRHIRSIIAAATFIIVAGACGIQPDAVPRDLAVEEQSIGEAADRAAPSASGAERIYLVAPGEERLLRSVPRQATSASDLLATLFSGPNEDELASQYRSFVPATTELLASRSQGQVLTIDVTGGLAELSGADLAQALAQIVYTASELEGVAAVEIRVDGEQLAWPKADLQTTSDPLSTFDYPNAVLSAQPEFPPLPGQQ